MSGYRDYDRVVLGAGVFGLYAAYLFCARGLSVAVIDVDPGQVMRASLVNQARVHNGYHYPRSVYTALRAASYYDRFVKDFPDAMNQRLTKLYAIAARGSFTDARHFEAFCNTVGIRARSVDPLEHFLPGAVEAAYETDEYSFDAPMLRRALLERIDRASGRCDWYLDDMVKAAHADGGAWMLDLRKCQRLHTSGVVNATYAGTNGVLATFGFDPLPLKYELCEVGLVEAPAYDGLGITVMDGPFFSIMPFGHSGRHSLTAVDYTPRLTSDATVPEFPCQSLNLRCQPAALDHCGLCPVRPASAHPHMVALARRFLRAGDDIRYAEAMHSVKTVLKTTEVDDARPTLVRVHSRVPLFVSVLSGKINTMYDLEEVL